MNPDYQKVQGLRIRNFRKRAGLSQLALENEIGASSGYLSRVENGEINPTKETLNEIARILKLNDREQDYLMGKIFYPPTEEEVLLAKEGVREYFDSKSRLAYLLDDRNRIIDVSKGFIYLLGLEARMRGLIYKEPFIKVVIEPKYRILEHLSPNYLEDIMFNFLLRYKSENGFMIDDPTFHENIEIINSNPYIKNVWDRVINSDVITVQTDMTRKVVFLIEGKEVELFYSDHIMLNYRRFEIVEYDSKFD
jgi:transcriptional regulator with XRE-family HTH domain